MMTFNKNLKNAITNVKRSQKCKKPLLITLRSQISPRIRKANFLSEFLIIDQNVLLYFFLIRRTSAPKKKSKQ